MKELFEQIKKLNIKKPFAKQADSITKILEPLAYYHSLRLLELFQGRYKAFI